MWITFLAVIFFAGRTPAHHCAIPHGGLANESIPFDEETGGLQKCEMYAENSTNVTTSCDYGWTYNNVDGDYTIVNEVIIVVFLWIYTFIDSNMDTINYMHHAHGFLFGYVYRSKWIHVLYLPILFGPVSLLHWQWDSHMTDCCIAWQEIWMAWVMLRNK